MILKVATVVVNTKLHDFEYPTDYASWEVSKVIVEMQYKHPDLTSMCVVLVPDCTSHTTKQRNAAQRYSDASHGE